MASNRDQRASRTDMPRPDRRPIFMATVDSLPQPYQILDLVEATLVV